MKKRIVSLLILLVMVLPLTACGKNSASIGIIGGADGPTAIFVTDDSFKTAVHIIQLSQIDMNSLPQINEFKPNPEIRGYAGNDTELPNIGSLNLIFPNDSGADCLIPGVSLTGYGIVDGKVHIQIKYDDVLNTDNHGLVYLKSLDGTEILCENGVDFWAENHKDSYQEYIFPALEEKQYNCEVWGEFWTA